MSAVRLFLSLQHPGHRPPPSHDLYILKIGDFHRTMTAFLNCLAKVLWTGQTKRYILSFWSCSVRHLTVSCPSVYYLEVWSSCVFSYLFSFWSPPFFQGGGPPKFNPLRMMMTKCCSAATQLRLPCSAVDHWRWSLVSEDADAVGRICCNLCLLIHPVNPVSRDVKNVFQYLLAFAHNRYLCSLYLSSLYPFARQAVCWEPFIPLVLI